MNPVREGVRSFLNTKEPEFVKINNDEIVEYARVAKSDEGLFYLPTWSPDSSKPYTSKVYPSDDWSKEEVVDFFGMINTINFCFWNKQNGEFSRYERNGLVGSNAMFSVVKEEFNRLKPASLVNERVNLEEMKEYFGDLTMLEERTRIFNQVGNRFEQEGYSSFTDLFNERNEAFNEGNGLVEILIKELPSFNDVGEYDALEFPFYKRAQLLPAMLYERLGEEEFPIEDVEEITVFADYQVPKSLEIQGILEYAPVLKEKIEDREMIEANSVMELEIRASTILACEEFTKEVNHLFEEEGMKKRVMDLNTDAYFWYMGTKNDKKYHLTKTTAY